VSALACKADVKAVEEATGRRHYTWEVVRQGEDIPLKVSSMIGAPGSIAQLVDLVTFSCIAARDFGTFTLFYDCFLAEGSQLCGLDPDVATCYLA
jgi:hypothetical protein